MERFAVCEDSDVRTFSFTVIPGKLRSTLSIILRFPSEQTNYLPSKPENQKSNMSSDDEGISFIQHPLA